MRVISNRMVAQHCATTGPVCPSVRYMKQQPEDTLKNPMALQAWHVAELVAKLVKVLKSGYRDLLTASGRARVIGAIRAAADKYFKKRKLSAN